VAVSSEFKELKVSVPLVVCMYKETYKAELVRKFPAQSAEMLV
jgi:hypothetical protein